MTTAVEQYQMLHAIWPRWHALAQSTNKDVPRTAETAVRRLYKFYDMPKPKVIWVDGPRGVPMGHPPVPLRVRDSLIFSVWHKLANPSWTCSQIGYDRLQHVFRLPGNLRPVFRTRSSLVSHTNFISQFDADALAIHELASKVGRIDSAMKTLAGIVTDIVSECFAAIVFQDTCVLIRKPSHVTLNPALELSAQGESAIAWPTSDTLPFGYKLYMINGEVVSIDFPPPLKTALDLIHYTPRLRALAIEYMGWERFLTLFKRALKHQTRMGLASHTRLAKLHQDRYGTLYRIHFWNQEFTVVRVKNSTPEPDGSYARVVLPVDPDLRPIPSANNPNGRMGAPQELTALNAVASTFGMRGEDYAASIGDES